MREYPDAREKEEKLEKNERKDGVFPKREHRRELTVQEWCTKSVCTEGVSPGKSGSEKAL